MAAITGLSIKSAVAVRLREIFGDECFYYREAVTNIEYPNFFIRQVTITRDRASIGRELIRCLINIRYRHLEDPAQSASIQEILDNVGLELIANLNTITVEDTALHIQNGDYFEKVDGVLYYFCNIAVPVELVAADEPFMETITINEEVT